MREPLAESPLRPEHFRRQDGSDDSQFYREARLVTHIDDAAIAAVTKFYGEMIPPGSLVLDIMTSWVSHLPPELAVAGVAGLGMNAQELAENPVLTERVIQDLNANPALPWADDTFDSAIVTVSV